MIQQEQGEEPDKKVSELQSPPLLSSEENSSSLPRQRTKQRSGGTQLIKNILKAKKLSSGKREVPKSQAKDEAATQLEAEGALQKEMLSDPRFGSPLLCDVVVMLVALVPLFCGLMQYFYVVGSGAAGGFHYGLILCGIFIFLLGLRSASIHLINEPDNTEERVLYILDKFGGSIWIPTLPDASEEDALAPGSGGADGHLAESPDNEQAGRQMPTTYRLFVDPESATVFQLKNKGGRGGETLTGPQA